jgi:hypothetical protein
MGCSQLYVSDRQKILANRKETKKLIEASGRDSQEYARLVWKEIEKRRATITEEAFGDQIALDSDSQCVMDVVIMISMTHLLTPEIVERLSEGAREICKKMNVSFNNMRI